ncbi:MAG: hypothetical protein KDC83_05000 [Flavobacteriales bacterium]|nr:hypothetical protein [Flavobacteriales bacterium]
MIINLALASPSFNKTLLLLNVFALSFYLGVFYFFGFYHEIDTTLFSSSDALEYYDGMRLIRIEIDSFNPNRPLSIPCCWVVRIS